MPNHRMAELIARALSGEATPEEWKELQLLGEQHPEDQYFLELLSEYWKTPGEMPDKEDLHPDAHFQHILECAQESVESDETPFPGLRGAKVRPWKWAAIAATLTGLVAGMFSYWHIAHAPKAIIPYNHTREVAVKSGAKSRLLLPDGTLVWLNSDSKLTYDSHFNGRTRECELEGEAFFDVAKNSNCPFIVHASGIDIRVLGTAFDVKSYPRESTTETTLIWGKIEVTKENGAKASRIILHPHEKLIIARDPDSALAPSAGKDAANPPPIANGKIPAGMAITHLPVNTPDTSVIETAWVYNKLVFDGETFKVMAAKMERWFNVKITFSDAQAAAYRFHATFENETIEEVLNSLQVTASFNYTITDNEVYIMNSGGPQVRH